jgi:hypothetical protein
MQFIRIEHKTNASDMVQFMYGNQKWNLEKPKLILSVTGGAQNFQIPQGMKKAFKEGLIKTAINANAWIGKKLIDSYIFI